MPFLSTLVGPFRGKRHSFSKKGRSVCLRVPKVPGSPWARPGVHTSSRKSAANFPDGVLLRGQCCGAVSCVFCLLNPQSSSYSHWFCRLRWAASSLPHIGICFWFDRGAGISSSSQPRQASTQHQPVRLEGVGVGGSPCGPTWAVAAAEPSPGNTSRRVRCLPLQAADHLSTGGTGRDQDFSSPLLLLGETDNHLLLDQPLSVSLPFKRRSSCRGSGKRHKGFSFLWLTSGEHSLTMDLLALI